MLRFQSTFEKLRFDYSEGMHADGHKHWSSATNNLLFNILYIELVTLDSNCKKAKTEKIKTQIKIKFKSSGEW